MNVLTVASPDKLAIRMFLDFIKSIGEYKLCDCHSLMSEEALKSFIEGSLKESKKVLFSYYSKKQFKKDPRVVCSSSLIEASDSFIWLPMFEMNKPDIVKDEGNNFERLYLKSWIEKINKFDNIEPVSHTGASLDIKRSSKVSPKRKFGWTRKKRR